jgi:putative transcriptional regulator
MARKTTTHKKRRENTIVRSAREALVWAKGGDVPGIRVTTVTVPAVDVRDLRRRLNLTQDEFATKFGFSRAVLRNWEQGRNQPDGAARVLLAVIDRHPEAVEDAIHS